MGRTRSFANIVGGHLGGSHNSQLMEWKCRACGFWDAFFVVISEDQDGNCNELKHEVSSKHSMSPGKKSGSKDC